MVRVRVWIQVRVRVQRLGLGYVLWGFELTVWVKQFANIVKTKTK